MKKLDDILNESLLKVDFDQRYYQFFEDHKNVEEILDINAARVITGNALKAVTQTAKYDTKEKFFRFQEEVPPYTISYTIAFGHGTKIELICTIRSAEGKAGGTAHGIARKVARLRDPNFEYSPRYPRLPYGNEDELNEAIKFSLSLFNDIKHVVVGLERNSRH